jgi:proteasome lid subunit RPN8/RPN11
MDSLGRKLNLRRIHWQMMLDDITERKSEEACGLVAGVDQTSLEVFPVTNILHSPVRYRMDPEQQLKCFNQIDENQWDLLAIYHSHPQGLHGPSPIDIADASYPGVIHLIWSQFNGKWNCRGYLIDKGLVEKVKIFRIKDETDETE